MTITVLPIGAHSLSFREKDLHRINNRITLANMKEDLISYKTAKLAKKKGFDWRVNTHYKEDDLINNGVGYNYNDPEEQGLWSVELLSAPTLSFLQKWLRENFKIRVWVSFECIDDSEYAYVWNIVTDTEKGRKKDSWDFFNLKTSFDVMMWWREYPEALDEGLQEGLKLIDQ